VSGGIGPKVAARIAQLRKARGWSMRELARRSGLPPESISRAERGLNEPSITSLDKICEGLGIDLPAFFSFASRPRLEVVAREEEIQHAVDLLRAADSGARRRMVGALDALCTETSSPKPAHRASKRAGRT
jgi:transcriptional regulator with XRE-family HTH domain